MDSRSRSAIWMRFGKGGFRQQEDELLTAVAPNDVRSPRVLAEAGGQRPEHLIAGGVTVGIVDLFEMIQIEHQCRERPVETHRALKLAFAELEESAAVQQAGQLITVTAICSTWL